MSKYMTKDFSASDVKSAMAGIDNDILTMIDGHSWIEGDWVHRTHILMDKTTGNYFSVEDARTDKLHDATGPLSAFVYWSDDWSGSMSLLQSPYEKVTEEINKESK